MRLLNIRYSQKYNGTQPCSWLLYRLLHLKIYQHKYDLPDGKKENENLAMYANAMKEIAEKNKVLFVDAFTPSKKWFENAKEPLTIDGSQLNDEGYTKLAVFLADEIFGKDSS